MTERLDAFMARANAAYYANHDPFADFTTAPEISQVFGETLGAWAAIVWAQLGRPQTVVLAELGPGRGTLMADALRLAGRVAADFAAAARVHFVERSPRLAAMLRERFPQAVLHGDVEELPLGPAIVIGNEFLDALPVRQFVRRGSGWAERFVADGAFVERPAAPESVPLEAGEGEVVELGAAAREVVGFLARRAARGDLAALLIDYGGEGRLPGGSLQALRAGRPADPLEAPGEADLTAHVDFDGLRELAAAAGAGVHGPLAQGLFLARLGLYPRLRLLARSSPDAAAAAERLTQPERMGVLFKALALTPEGLVPPGFEPDRAGAT